MKMLDRVAVSWFVLGHRLNTVILLCLGRGQNILSCFSASSSLKKLVYCERRPEGLEMLDGVRFLAVSWFVIGHRFQLSLQVPRFSLVNDEKVH